MSSHYHEPGMRPGRRGFLKAGLAGTLFLAMLPHARPGAGSAPAAGLNPEQREVLRAIVPVMLAGAIPDGTQRSEAVGAVLNGVDVAVRALPPHLQAELGQLFSLLTFAPARVLVARVPTAWRQADADSIAAFLDRWRTSWFTLLRSAYQALHELIMAAWYAQPASWMALRYPGPPRIG